MLSCGLQPFLGAVFAVADFLSLADVGALERLEICSIMSASFDDRFISAVMILRPIPTQIVERIIVLPSGESQG